MSISYNSYSKLLHRKNVLAPARIFPLSKASIVYEYQLTERTSTEIKASAVSQAAYGDIIFVNDLQS